MSLPTVPAHYCTTADCCYYCQSPGTKDGEIKVVREGGSVVAHSWSVADFKWERIGEVVSDAGGGGGGQPGGIKRYHAGREWDFVFDVDVEDGAPTRKLALNRDDNPYIVADRFLEEEGLPQHFKENVVQFILQNTAAAAAGAAAGGSVTGGFCDPFTGGAGGGGGRGQAAPPPAAAAGGFFAPGSVTGGGVDPFTGGGGGGALSSSSSTVAGTSLVPLRTYLAFDAVPPSEPLQKKLVEFSGQLALAGGSARLALTDGEAAQLEHLLKTVLPAAAATSSSSSAAAAAVQPSGDVAPLLSKLLSWPQQCIFPVLDVVRVLLLSRRIAAAVLAPLAGSCANPAEGTLAQALATATAPPAPAAAMQTCLRMLCNCFASDALRDWALEQRSGIVDRCASAANSDNKAVRMSLATLCANYAVALRGGGGGDALQEGKMQVLSAAVELLTAMPPDDYEAGWRGLAAVGTLVAGDGDMKSLAADLGLSTLVDHLRGQPGASDKLRAAADGVRAVM